MAAEQPKEPVKPEKTEAPKGAPRRDQDNVVFIGSKPVMNYVMACLTLFNMGGREVCIKARGVAISRAVDTIEVLRRSFLKNVGIKGIKIGTEEVTREEGRRSNVSTIEIVLAKAEPK